MSQDLLQDVDNMVRQERLLAIWQQYGNYIVGAVVAVIAAVALYQGQQAWHQASARANTAALLQAADGPQAATALAVLATEKNGNTGAIARLLAAATLLEKGDREGAAALYLATRNDARVNKDLRDLATLNWVRLVMDRNDQKPADLLSALSPLMAQEALPFAWAARLESAVIKARLMGDIPGATALLAPMLNNPALPYTQAERARALQQVYATEGAQPTKQTNESKP